VILAAVCLTTFAVIDATIVKAADQILDRAIK
jgi:hypothetical protein